MDRNICDARLIADAPLLPSLPRCCPPYLRTYSMRAVHGYAHVCKNPNAFTGDLKPPDMQNEEELKGKTCNELYRYFETHKGFRGGKADMCDRNAYIIHNPSRPNEKWSYFMTTSMLANVCCRDRQSGCPVEGTPWRVSRGRSPAVCCVEPTTQRSHRGCGRPSLPLPPARARAWYLRCACTDFSHICKDPQAYTPDVVQRGFSCGVFIAAMSERYAFSTAKEHICDASKKTEADAGGGTKMSHVQLTTTVLAPSCCKDKKSSCFKGMPPVHRAPTSRALVALTASVVRTRPRHIDVAKAAILHRCLLPSPRPARPLPSCVRRLLLCLQGPKPVQRQRSHQQQPVVR